MSAWARISRTAILSGTAEVGIPTLLSTLAICVVFVPVFPLTGTAKYLFSPLSLSVILSLLASLVLSFTLVPVLFKYLFKPHDIGLEPRPETVQSVLGLPRRLRAWVSSLSDGYRSVLTWVVSTLLAPGLFFLLLGIGNSAAGAQLGMDFFPAIDAGQMRLHVRAPPGTRIEQTQTYFAEVEKAVRKIVGSDQIDVILDNIGLPYSGINIALSDSATVGPMDGEILISLKENHTPTAAHVADLRRELPKLFSGAAVLFPAGGYRQSGAELRPAGADRRPRLGAGQRQGLCRRPEARERPQRRARDRRFPCVSGARCSRDQDRRRPRQGQGLADRRSRCRRATF